MSESKSAYGAGKAVSINIIAPTTTHSFSQNDTDFRRKWDKDEYEQKARERDRAERERISDRHDKDRKRKRSSDPKPTELLKARDKNDLTKTLYQNLNKTTLVNMSADRNKQPGFPCEVCKRIFKDSIAYTDHVNSRQHQRALGISMKVERVSTDDVKNRLAMLKQKKSEPEKMSKDYDIEQKLDQVKKQEELSRLRRLEKKQQRKKLKDESDEEEDEQKGSEDMMEMMGFTEFGSTKV